MTLEEMKKRKKELGYTNAYITKVTGIPLGTVQKIFSGRTKAPRMDTVAALERLLSGGSSMPASVPAGRVDQGQPGQSSYERGGSEQDPPQAYRYGPSLGGPPHWSHGMLKEELAAYGYDEKQGSYTLDDYYALPDERRVELIDGWIYDMAAPTRVHQLVLQELHLQLASCVEQHPECELYLAPTDVRLNNDNWTMVQPDVLVICGGDDDPKRINGAPDFIIEILSPSSRYHDMFRKLNKYCFAGVREYWIVDPQSLKITVYLFENDMTPAVYDFNDTVPVGISEGECRVDFTKVRKKIEKYL